MNEFICGNYSAAITVFEGSLGSLSDKCLIGLVHTNIASCSHRLELHRKAIKSCLVALKIDPNCLAAYILLGKAYVSVDRKNLALESWKEGLLIATNAPVCDVSYAVELRNLITSMEASSIGESGDVENITNNSNNSCADVNIHHETICNVSVEDISVENISVKEDNMVVCGRKADKNGIVSLHNQFLRNSNFIISNPTVLPAIVANLPHKSGDRYLDELVAFGYLQVNLGNVREASTLFQLLLNYRSDTPSAYLGLGSALAMQGELSSAISCFSNAIDAAPTLVDAWKRRGQTKAAKGELEGALSDLNYAAELENNSNGEVINQRGLIFLQLKNYRRALLDFRQAEKLGLISATLQNAIGICESQQGHVQRAIVAHKKAGKLDPSLREAFLNVAQMFKENGDADTAEQKFLIVCAMDSSTSQKIPFHQAHSYLALLFYGTGRPRRCLKESLIALDMLKDLSNDSKDVQSSRVASLSQSGVCCHSLGSFSAAVSYYDQALAIDSSSVSWYQRQFALAMWNCLDNNLNQFNFENIVHPSIKSGWCKRAPWFQYVNSFQLFFAPKTIPDVIFLGPERLLTSHFHKTYNDRNLVYSSLVSSALKISHWILLKSPGFLPNRRQQLMFGLGVIEMTQKLCQVVKILRDEGNIFIASNAAASSKAFRAQLGNAKMKTSSTSTEIMCHAFGWRDLMDIAVRWRQVSEPNDPVWWIDRMPTKEFEEGFGLQTPIVTGQLKTIRYYSFFPAALKVVKDLLKTSNYYSAANVPKQLDSSMRDKVAKIETLEELYSLIGEDFYVIQPCPSSFNPNLIMEGTRVTLLRHHPEGFEFTIRTPGTPSRFNDFDIEMKQHFSHLIEVLASLEDIKEFQAEKESEVNICTEFGKSDMSGKAGAVICSSCNGGVCSSSCQQGKSGSMSSRRQGQPTRPSPVADASFVEGAVNMLQHEQEQGKLYRSLQLKLFYYWACFAPLSRGTAACGYMMLAATLLATKRFFTTSLTRQLDWDAIFSTNVDQFISTAALPEPCPFVEFSVDTIPIMNEHITTLRHMLEILSFADESDVKDLHISK